MYYFVIIFVKACENIPIEFKYIKSINDDKMLFLKKIILCFPVERF
jgi:hypothetical protein